MTDATRCPTCGKAIRPGDRFCAACGQQLDEPGFVPPAVPLAAPAATAGVGGEPWAAPAQGSAADAAWMRPAAGRAALAEPGRGEDGEESEATPIAAPAGTSAAMATAPPAHGWGTPVGPQARDAVAPVAATEPERRTPDPTPAAETGEIDSGSWFVATNPATLAAWGVVAVVGGLLLGAIGQIDPTDTLVILAFLIVPLGLLLLVLAMVCRVVQGAVGRR